MKKIILFFVFAILFSSCVNALYLQGEVRDSLTNSPISGCQVFASSSSGGGYSGSVLTSGLGTFTMGDIECTTYSVKIMCGGQEGDFGTVSGGYYNVFFMGQDFDIPFDYKQIEGYQGQDIPYSDYDPNVEIPTPEPSYPPEPSYTTPTSELGKYNYYPGPGSTPTLNNPATSGYFDTTPSDSTPQITDQTVRGGAGNPSSTKNWDKKVDSKILNLKSALEKGYLASAKEIESNLIYSQEVKEQCSKSCCETDGGISKDNPNIVANCYDKDGAHWDEWGKEYSCSGGSKITGNAVLNFLAGWAVKDEVKCVETDSFVGKTGLTKKEFLNFGKKHPLIASKIIMGKELSIDERRIALGYIADVYGQNKPYASKYLKLYLNPEQLNNLPKSEWYGDKETNREGTLYPVYNIVPDWTKAGGLNSENLFDISFNFVKNPEKILEIYESGEEAWILEPNMANAISPLELQAMGFFGVYIQKGENGKAIIRVKDFYDWFARPVTGTTWEADEYISNLASVFGFDIKTRSLIDVKNNRIEVKDITLVDLGQPYIMWGEWEIPEEQFLKYDWKNALSYTIQIGANYFTDLDTAKKQLEDYKKKAPGIDIFIVRDKEISSMHLGERYYLCAGNFKDSESAEATVPKLEKINVIKEVEYKRGYEKIE